MEMFAEDTDQQPDGVETSFKILNGEAEAIIGKVGQGDTHVTYQGPEGEFQETMEPHQAAKYWSEAVGDDTRGSYDGELPDPSELGKQFDSTGHVAPVEAYAALGDESEMSYFINAEVDHNGEEAELWFTNTKTRGDIRNTDDLRQMVEQTSGETEEAYKTILDNF